MSLRPPPLRLLALALGALAVLVAALELHRLDRTAPWYDKVELNAPVVVDALALNSGVTSPRASQSGLPSVLLLALDFRVRHALGQPVVANLAQLEASPHPLAELPPLLHAARTHGRILVLLLVVVGALAAGHATRSAETGGLAAALLASSAGLLYHGSLARPELLAAGLGGIVLPFLLAWSTTHPQPAARDLGLFASGLAAGLATLCSQPCLWLLVTAAGWCAVTAGTPDGRGSYANPHRWLPALAAGAGVLVLLEVLGPYRAMAGHLSVHRARLAAVIVALLPLVALARPRAAAATFALERVRECALLAGGALAVLPLSFLALRLALPHAEAAESTAHLLKSALLGPDRPLLYLPGLAAELRRFALESPGLLAGALVLLGAVALGRGLGRAARARAAYLLVSALGLLVLLCDGRAADTDTVLVQVPCLLAWACLAPALGVWGAPAARPPAAPWAGPLVLAAALALLLTAGLRLRLKHVSDGLNSAAPAVTDVTVAFLYSHSAHPKAYLDLMDRRYGSRPAFADALQDYLDRSRSPRR